MTCGPSSPLSLALALTLLGLVLGCTTDKGAQGDASAAPDAGREADASPSPLKELRVRVWVDNDYAAEHPNWREELDAQLLRVNTLVGPQLGARLALVGTKPWAVETRRGDLEGALEELERLDEGEEVDQVIGWVNADGGAAVSSHELGLARPFGQHVVLRKLNDEAELAALRRSLPEVGEEEARNIWKERRAHKDATALLHHWAHALGALHVTPTTFVMSETYEPTQSSFSAANARLISASLSSEARPNGERIPEPLAIALLEILSRSPNATWDLDAKSGLVDMIERSLLVGKLGANVANTFPREDAERLRDAQKAFEEGAPKRALEILHRLLDRYPDNREVFKMGCTFAAAVDEPDAYPLSICRQAEKLLDDDPTPSLATTRIYLAQGKPDLAADAALRADQRLRATSTADPDTWAILVYLHQRLDAVGLAEAASSKLEDPERQKKVLAWAKETRRYHGLPKSSLPPTREREYIETSKTIDATIREGALDEADALLAEASRRFGRVGGLSTLGCIILGRRGKLDAAQKKCTEALQYDPEAFRAHLMLGQIAERRKRLPAAVRHYKRVMVLDPSVSLAWRRLRGVYRAQRNSKAVETLEADYKALFGEPL